MTNIFKAIALSVPLWLSASLVLAAGEQTPEIQSLDEIGEAVRDFIVSQQETSSGVEVKVKPVDRRLRLHACSTPLETDWSPGSRTFGRVTVQVECAQPKPWRLHVQSSVTVEGLIWTMGRSVRRGDVLSRDLVEQKMIKVGAKNPALRSSGVPVANIEPWLGYAFTQRVSAGQVLDERMLKPALLVKKGETVLIVHESTGLQLQAKGVAITSAAEGQRVQVKNSSSGKVIEAIVVDQGLVETL